MMLHSTWEIYLVKASMTTGWHYLNQMWTNMHPENSKTVPQIMARWKQEIILQFTRKQYPKCRDWLSKRCDMIGARYIP